MSLNRRASMNQHVLPIGNIGARHTQNNNNNNNNSTVNLPMPSPNPGVPAGAGALVPLETGGGGIMTGGGGVVTVASGSVPRISVVQPRPTRPSQGSFNHINARGGSGNQTMAATFALFDRGSSSTSPSSASLPRDEGGGLGFSDPDTNASPTAGSIMMMMSMNSQEGE